MIIIIVNKAQFDYFFEVFSKLIQRNRIKFGPNLPATITEDCTDCTDLFHTQTKMAGQARSNLVQ